MKIQTNLGNIMLKIFLGIVLTAPLFSCANLDEVWERFDEEDARLDSIEARLDSLESSLNSQIQALDDLLSGKITISSCKRNDNGSHVITLTDGTTFTVYPKSMEYSTLLTYKEENGVKYWAFYDAIGNVTVLTDKDGNKIPVEAELPVVEEVDGEFILSIGGKEYTTGYTPEDVVTVFSDYELHTDDSGNVYAVTFTFGEGMTFTVNVADYKGLSFHMVGDVNERVIKDYYVGYGNTSRLKVGMEGVVDYVMQIPDGWRVKEVMDEYTAEVFIDVTAPLETAVAAGAAVASGELKVVAVLEDGKSMVAKLTLATSPFKKFTATSSNAVIEKYNGVDKVLFGLSAFADYDEAAILAGADAMIQANDGGVSDTDVNVLLSALLGSELTTGERYVLWALPVFYKEEGEEATWVVDENLLVTYQFGAITATVTVKDEDVLFNDVIVSVKLAGFQSYYGGTSVKTETVHSEIIYEINNGIADSYTEPLTYTGSAFAFPTAAANAGLEVLSEETYVTWIVPVEEGKTEYTVDDIVYKEYTLPGVSAGGTLSITPGTAVVDRVSIQVPLATEGAARIYYAFLTQRNASRYGDNTKRAEYLLANGTIANAASVNALAENLEPDTKMTLFAMAVDNKGKYGEVSVTQYTTDELVYNDLKVSLEKKNVGEDNASISVTVKGGTATKFVYWAGRETDEFWTSLSTNSSDRPSAAQKFLALYPEDDAVTRVMNKYPMIDGVIEMTDLVGETNYQVVVLAQDANGDFSMAGTCPFTTLAVNLGTVVTSSMPAWTTAKNSITITYLPQSYSAGGESARYKFTYQGPTDFTAYIAAGHLEYFDGVGYIMTVPEKILEIRNHASRPIDGSYVGDQKEIYYDDQGNEQEWGQANFVIYGTHGLPSWGAVTYFSSHHHDESNCEICEERVTDPTATSDRSYEGQLATIQAKTTLEYWMNIVREYRGVTNETYVLKSAQALLDLYYDHYNGLKPLLYINDGTPLEITQAYATGPDDEGVVKDAVIVVLRDQNDNYYEPMFFPVENHW